MSKSSGTPQLDRHVWLERTSCKHRLRRVGIDGEYRRTVVVSPPLLLAWDLLHDLHANASCVHGTSSTNLASGDVPHKHAVALVASGNELAVGHRRDKAHMRR